MGQALPKPHWEASDRFLAAAELYVPAEEADVYYQEQSNYRMSVSSVSTDEVNGHPAHPPVTHAKPSRPTAGDALPYASSPPPATSAIPPSVSCSTETEHVHEAYRAPPEIAAVSTAEAYAIAAANWIEVMQLARGFERVYARALEAWVAAEPSPGPLPPPASLPPPLPPKSVKRMHAKRDSGCADDGCGYTVPAAAAAGSNSSSGDESWGDGGAVSELPTSQRANVASWTPADLIDQATQGGPLRCYRWHSDGKDRAGKERSRRQLIEDAVRFGWCGRLLVRHFGRMAKPMPSNGNGSWEDGEEDEEDEEDRNDGKATFDEETGLASMRLRVPTTAPLHHAQHLPPIVGIATVDAALTTSALLSIPATALVPIKLLSTLYPAGPPWSTATFTYDGSNNNNNNNVDADSELTAAETGSTPASAHHQRVWVAMSLGWASALDALIRAQRSAACGSDGDGSSTPDVVVDDDVDGSTDEWQSWNALDFEVEMLASLTRPPPPLGWRQKCMVPSDDEDDECDDDTDGTDDDAV